MFSSSERKKNKTCIKALWGVAWPDEGRFGY